jgi:hypothetical protein
MRHIAHCLLMVAAWRAMKRMQSSTLAAFLTVGARMPRGLRFSVHSERRRRTFNVKLIADTARQLCGTFDGATKLRTS